LQSFEELEEQYEVAVRSRSFELRPAGSPPLGTAAKSTNKSTTFIPRILMVGIIVINYWIVTNRNRGNAT
jgi:hypothetical protein